MMGLALFLVLGAAFLVLLSLFARGSETGSNSTAEAVIEAREALHSLQTSLLAPELVDHIFAKTDLQFVRAACSPRVQEKFLSERRTIALTWVAHLRQQLLSLKQFHTAHARRFAELNPRRELVLAVDFAASLLACRILQLTLYLRGPYAASGMVRRAAGIAGKVCEVSERSLAFLNPPGTHLVEHGSAGSGAIP
jgi:hypothetical protein